MFGRRYTLFRLSGFEVGIDLSWIILAILVAWSLSMGYFPVRFRGLPSQIYWFMGIAGAVGLFISIVLHEFAHSLVARWYGMKMKGITLFIFGGVAEMGDEPPSPGAELLMAAAGPLSSLALAGLLYGAGWLSSDAGGVLFAGVLGYLAFINLLLAIFNMLPAFPLDGGRVLRSILWRFKGDLRWATRVSAGIGSAFGIFLIVMGIARFLFGNLIGGLWLFLIGMFLQAAARASLQQVIAREALAGEPLKRFMKTDPVTVRPSMPISELVDNYLYKYNFQLYPVVEFGQLVGCITSREVGMLARQSWADTPVSAVMKPCSQENIISPMEDAVVALKKMKQNDTSRLMVVEGGRLTGIIVLKDMLQFLSRKIALEKKHA